MESQMSDEIIESQKVICLNLFTSKLFAVVLFWLMKKGSFVEHLEKKKIRDMDKRI